MTLVQVQGEVVYVLPRAYYMLYVPQTGRVWNKAFFQGGLDEGPYPRHARHSVKCPVSRRYSPKTRRFKHQAINLSFLKTARASEDGPLVWGVFQSCPLDVNLGLPRHSRHAALTNYCCQRQDTPARTRAVQKTAWWNVLDYSTSCCWMPHISSVCGPYGYISKPHACVCKYAYLWTGGIS